MELGIIFSTITNMKGNLPPIIVNPLEYGFLIDVRALRPWQWLNLFNAVITIAFFIYADTFRSYVEHSAEDLRLQNKIQSGAWWIELGRRARFISSVFILVIAFIHATLWATSIESHLDADALNLFKWFFGSAMPPAQI